LPFKLRPEVFKGVSIRLHVDGQVNASVVNYRELKRIPYILLLLQNGVNDHGFTRVNVSDLSRQIGTTPQNVSKVLKRLEREGYVIRSGAKGEVSLMLSERGSALLRSLMDLMESLLGRNITIVLRGVVTTGLGEGGYYMSLEGYRRQFTSKLGFDPYPGTLNVRLLDQYVKYRLYLERIPGIRIEGFSNGARTYGGVKAFKCVISGIQCGVLLVERTSHGPEVIEVIAPVKLRDRLNLRDGDEVTINILL
jgi:riboflavin kinase